MRLASSAPIRVSDGVALISASFCGPAPRRSDDRVTAGAEDGLAVVLPSHAVAKVVGLAQHVEDLADPLTVTYAVTGDDHHVTRTSRADADCGRAHEAPPFRSARALPRADRVTIGARTDPDPASPNPGSIVRRHDR